MLERSFHQPVVFMIEMNGCIACYLANDKFKSVAAEFPDIFAVKIVKELFYVSLRAVTSSLIFNKLYMFLRLFIHII